MGGRAERECERERECECECECWSGLPRNTRVHKCVETEAQASTGVRRKTGVLGRESRLIRAAR
jgi:hypothetical protein